MMNKHFRSTELNLQQEVWCIGKSDDQGYARECVHIFTPCIKILERNYIWRIPTWWYNQMPPACHCSWIVFACKPPGDGDKVAVDLRDTAFDIEHKWCDNNVPILHTAPSAYSAQAMSWRRLSTGKSLVVLINISLITMLSLKRLFLFFPCAAHKNNMSVCARAHGIPECRMSLWNPKEFQCSQSILHKINLLI